MAAVREQLGQIEHPGSWAAEIAALGVNLDSKRTGMASVMASAADELGARRAGGGGRGSGAVGAGPAHGWPGALDIARRWMRSRSDFAGAGADFFVGAWARPDVDRRVLLRLATGRRYGVTSGRRQAGAGHPGSARSGTAKLSPGADTTWCRAPSRGRCRSGGSSIAAQSPKRHSVAAQSAPQRRRLAEGAVSPCGFVTRSGVSRNGVHAVRR
jgi:hypothetical protein